MCPISLDKEALELAAVLRREGIDPAAAPEAAVTRLREMREKGEAPDLALAQALEQVRSDSAVQLLAEIAARTHGAPKRAAKRALFKLRRSGLMHELQAGEVPLAAGAKNLKVESKSVDSALTALLSSFDTDGARIVWLLKDLPQGGVRRLWGVVSQHRGLIALMSGRLSRRQVREERAEVEHESGLQMIEADPRLADFILCEAYRRTAESARAAVGNFLRVRAELINAPVPTEIDHPVYRELAGTLNVMPSPLLLDDPLMTAFAPPRAELQSFANELEDIRQSPLLLSSVQQQERMAQIADRALKHVLEGERRTIVKRYLEDIAYYLVRVGRREPARWAAAAAEMLAHGVDVRRVPFFQRWIQSGLNAALSDMEQREREGPRLILTPAEARREAVSRRVQR
jgi:hypothetical protein